MFNHESRGMRVWAVGKVPVWLLVEIALFVGRLLKAGLGAPAGSPLVQHVRREPRTVTQKK